MNWIKSNWNDLTTRTELPKHTLKYNCVYLCLSLTHCLTSSAVHYSTHTRTHIHARERGETKENKRKQTSAEAHRLQMIGNATKIAKETCSVFCLDFNNIFLKFTFCCCIHSVSCTFVLCTPTINWLHSALELRFFCLSLFLFYYFASRTTVDVVARSAAAWMNISAASNFLKQLSDERNTRQINTCVCVCLCWVFIYMRCSLCAAVYIQRERGLCTPMCVCVSVLCTETTSYIYLCTSSCSASFGNTQRWQHATQC